MITQQTHQGGFSHSDIPGNGDEFFNHLVGQFSSQFLVN